MALRSPVAVHTVIPTLSFPLTLQSSYLDYLRTVLARARGDGMVGVCGDCAVFVPRDLRE